jgi:hypothetical protein
MNGDGSNNLQEVLEKEIGKQYGLTMSIRWYGRKGVPMVSNGSFYHISYHETLHRDT